MDKQMWSIHTVEYHSALKKEEVLTPATLQVGLEDMMPSERSQTEKATYCVIPLLGGPRVVKFMQTERKSKNTCSYT